MNKVQSFLAKNLLGIRGVDMSGANNIFGTLGSKAVPIVSSKSFIPSDGNGGTIDLTGNGDGGNAVWLGLDTKIMQFWAYVFCSPLSGVIDRLAEADTNGRMRFIDEDTRVPIKNYRKNPKLLRIKKLFRKPNPWQTWEEFEGEQVVICKIFGYCPTFAIGSDILDRSYTSAFVNINPIFLNPVKNENHSIFKKEGIIKSWDLNLFGQTYSLPAKDIILFTDGYISRGTNDLGLPLSKVSGMDFFISNICAAMEADNVILKKKGPLGVFSFDPGKDMAGATPLDPNAKDELQKDLSRYGLTIGQIQYVISKMPVKWNAMSFNLRDLMTKEIIRNGIDGICDRFGYPAELMSGKNATYENRSSSEKFLYQNNIIPFSLRRITKYNEFFGLEDIILNKDYNHLPVLQEDIVKAGEASKAESEGLEIEWRNGMITFNQWQNAKGRDSISGMDIYYPEWLKQNPELNQNKNKEDVKTSSEDTGIEE